MTLKQYYDFARKSLPTPSEAILLTEHFFNADRREIALNPNKIPANGGDFLNAIKKRATGYPLQYILGYWFFGDMKLYVTEGVLIPREDTMTLVEAAAEFIGDKPYVGLDLCAGTGAVCLMLSHICKNTKITALELFAVPFFCLKRNIEVYGNNKITSMKEDVLNGVNYKNLDFIVSNPPYIGTREINTLQSEVQNEPHEALDGGEDGLVFYRAIAEKWSKSLRPGGLLAVEIGDTQSAEVETLFRQNKLINIQTIIDINSKNRVVTALYNP